MFEEAPADDELAALLALWQRVIFRHSGYFFLQLRIIIVNIYSMQNSRSIQIRPEPVREQLDAAPRVLPSHDLFQGMRALVIEHDGDCYVLRITRNGKLILTK